MSKYIIKNCPAYLGADCTGFGNGGCKDCTNCPLKQIVDLCKRDKNFCINCKIEADNNIDCIECTEGGRAELGAEILKLLDVKEVN